jgi:hypothetical protein
VTANAWRAIGVLATVENARCPAHWNRREWDAWVAGLRAVLGAQVYGGRVETIVVVS